MFKFLFFILVVSQQIFAEAIQDNSFLVEEAYNQESGVVQFINVYQKDKNSNVWGYTLINEIPVISQSHQFSYELPVLHSESPSQTELGDVKLNYRYEFFRSEKIVTTARVSLLTPTGKYDKATGTGQIGSEVSLISSIMINDQWVQHWNIGSGFVPLAKEIDGGAADNSKFFLGMSQVYLLSDKLNLMLESVLTSSQSTIADKVAEWSTDAIVSPSLRYAFDYKDWQFVPGFAVPMGVGASAGDVQYLLYLSIEGKMF